MEPQQSSFSNFEAPPAYNNPNPPPPATIVIPVQAPSCYDSSYCSTQPQLDPRAGRIIWIIPCIFITIFLIGLIFTILGICGVFDPKHNSPW